MAHEASKEGAQSHVFVVFNLFLSVGIDRFWASIARDLTFNGFVSSINWRLPKQRILHGASLWREVAPWLQQAAATPLLARLLPQLGGSCVDRR